MQFTKVFTNTFSTYPKEDKKNSPAMEKRLSALNNFQKKYPMIQMKNTKYEWPKEFIGFIK